MHGDVSDIKLTVSGNDKIGSYVRAHWEKFGVPPNLQKQ